MSNTFFYYCCYAFHVDYISLLIIVLVYYSRFLPMSTGCALLSVNTDMDQVGSRMVYSYLTALVSYMITILIAILKELFVPWIFQFEPQE